MHSLVMHKSHFALDFALNHVGKQRNGLDNAYCIMHSLIRGICSIRSVYIV